jgi:hypothetical protein
MNTPLFKVTADWKHRTPNIELRTLNRARCASAFEVGRSMFNVRCCLLAGLLLFAHIATAGVPQPMCIYYGEALDGYGLPYTTNAEVILLHGTNEIASHTITGSLTPGINFALYVHLDDGTTAQPYSPRALRSGDLVSIIVHDPEGVKTIMEESAIPPVGQPGQTILINATAGTDTNHDGLPDQWEQALVFWSFGALTNISQVKPNGDFDKDGQSNLSEYLAGTSPFLSSDYFHIADYGWTVNRRLRMTFLTAPGKIYGVRYVTDPGLSRWTPAPIAPSDTANFQTTPLEGNGDWMSIYVPGNLKSALFRPTVESFGSYPLTATNFVTSLTASDRADNAPYPTSQFQLGDNGGVNFGPWVNLAGSGTTGSRYLAGSIGDSSHSWALSGTYAVGRALPGIAHHGLFQIRMVSNPNNIGFAGFNLKSAALSGFGETEVIRVGMTPAPIASIGKGISVSTDGGKTYTFLDCGWADGRGEPIVYQIYWDESGRYTLTVANTAEDITSQFTGKLPTSAVDMLGVGVLGGSTAESIQFDSLRFQTTPGLAMQKVGDNMELWWLAGFAGYTLESSPGLSPAGSWTPVNGTMASADGINSMTVPITGSQQFFRLSN